VQFCSAHLQSIYELKYLTVSAAKETRLTGYHAAIGRCSVTFL